MIFAKNSSGGFLLRRGVAGLLFLLASPSSWAQELQRWAVNMPRGVTEVSRDVFNLHMLIFWICVAIGVLVFAIMFYSLIAHRRSRHATPATFHGSTKLEILWTAAAFLILVAMVWPSTRSLIHMYDTSDADMDVLVTGYQWKWKYDYLNEGVSFFSTLATSRDAINNDLPKDDHYLLDVDQPLVLPVGQKVRLLITAADVLHSWWVPDFAVKRDAVPGFISETWLRADTVGVYRGQCTELCGKDHGFMPVVVDVRSAEDYAAWLSEERAKAAHLAQLKEKTFDLEELMVRGREVYQKNCVSCHLPNGQGLPGAFPSLVGTDMMRGSLQAHLDIVINGKAGTAMAAFGAQLNEVDLASVISYERNAWGNDSGDIVQPLDVARFQGK